ncbi:MAG: sensor histidine kinase [Brachybacterium tyrofermentans]
MSNRRQVRQQGSRFAWLMTGAAIGTTVVLVLALVVPVPRQQLLPVPLLLPGVLLAILLGGLLGLVPGVRELEVTAARSMLGVDSELVVPSRPGLVHRAQDVVWVQLHLLLGLLVAAFLTMLLPASVLTLVEALRGGESTLVPTASTAAGRFGIAAAALLSAVLSLAAFLPLGRLAARLAPRLLGPTSRDRLELALARIDRESERTRIARELHDGIGHALTIVSIQAAAGGHVIARDQDAAAQSLAQIEATAREALLDLDEVLAGLRDEAADGEAADGEAAYGEVADGGAAPRLDRVLEDHRRAGLDLRASVAVPRGLSRLQHEHLARIVTELLTNAHRHGGAGPVQLRVAEGAAATGERVVSVETSNPLSTTALRRDDARSEGSEGSEGSESSKASGVSKVPEASASRRRGRGLAGLRERLELWGGTLEAGPSDGSWRARAELPILSERPRHDP